MSIMLTIIGHVGQDPIQRTVNTASGVQTVTNFSVASNNPRQPNADATWYRVTVWGAYGDSIMANVSKGQHVTVIADDLRLNTYEDQHGAVRTSLEVRAVSVSFDPRPRYHLSQAERAEIMELLASRTQQPAPSQAPARTSRRASSSRSPRRTRQAASADTNIIAGDFAAVDLAPAPDGDIPF